MQNKLHVAELKCIFKMMNRKMSECQIVSDFINFRSNFKISLIA